MIIKRRKIIQIQVYPSRSNDEYKSHAILTKVAQVGVDSICYEITLHQKFDLQKIHYESQKYKCNIICLIRLNVL